MCGKWYEGGQGRGLTAMRRECGYYSNTDNSIKSCPRQSYWFSCGAAAGSVVSSYYDWMFSQHQPGAANPLSYIWSDHMSTKPMWKQRGSYFHTSKTRVGQQGRVSGHLLLLFVALVKHQQSHYGGLSSSLSSFYSFNHNNSASYTPLLVLHWWTQLWKSDWRINKATHSFILTHRSYWLMEDALSIRQLTIYSNGLWKIDGISTYV